MSSNGDYHDPNASHRLLRRKTTEPAVTVGQSDRARIGAGEQIRQPSDRWLNSNIAIYVRASQPELLQGLEQWLQLNLIAQAQVKQLARNYLSCTLPEPKVIESSSQAVPEPEAVAEATYPNILTRVWQGFLDELSIRWLLFLGIFLVIVSSGVLAVSQWQNFPLVGQYLVLLAYTFGFFGISIWTNQQELKLTSQTLRAIAILLIPIDFWAISYLGTSDSIEWIVTTVATVILTAISLISWRKQTKLFSFAFWFLSCLHLGWQITLLPLLAIYGGITIVSLTYYKFLLPSSKYSTTNLLFLLAAWLLLLARRLSGAVYFIPNYCLAIAIFAWLLATVFLARSKQTTVVALESSTWAFFEQISLVFSVILLTAAWLRSVVAGVVESPLFFYQTIGISALAIHLCSQRLILYWRKRDLTAIFTIGLSTIYIAKELIPDRFRSQAIDLAITASKTEYFPESVFGVTLFPYLILFVFIASWLYRQQKPQLALYAEYLTLTLGIVLTCLSISNPTWRSLNLFFSTLTLGYVAMIRHPVRSSLIYLTHLLGLTTLIQAIAMFLPNISQPLWGSILVALVATEWSIYLYGIKHRFRRFSALVWQSCWYFGLLLGTVSYSFFWWDKTASISHAVYWRLIWLVIPAMLTAIANYTQILRQKRLATSLSCIALIVAQLLILEQPETRLIGLTIATGLMFANALNLRRTIVTIIHLGFGLCLLASLFAIFVDDWWLLIGAVTILGLYRLRLHLRQTIDTPKFDYISQRNAHGILGVGVETKNFKLIAKYIHAADYWAIAIGTLVIAVLSIFSLSAFIFNFQLQSLLTIVSLVGAIIWRYHQQPRHWIACVIVWLGELLTIGVISFFGGGGLAIAIANIITGLIALVILRQISSSNSPWQQLDLFYVPFIYAALAMLWRLPYYYTHTGLLTLGAAIIFLNTQSKNSRANTAIDYLAYATISGGIGESIVYYLRSSRVSLADGFTILALTAAAIAFSYRLIAWWYARHQTQLNSKFNLSRIILVAHLHWAVGSILKIIAAGVAIDNTAINLTFASIATSLCLGAYAVVQGKSPVNTSKVNDWWVYVGLVEITATLVYSRLIISKLSLFDPWRIIFTCAIALLIYQIPWHNLGWRTTPWQRTAIITPALMTLVIAEDVSYFGLLAAALFYWRIAYGQKNIRWSYVSLGFIDWGVIRLAWQNNAQSVWLAAISLSILYIAQFDPYYQSHRKSRHYLRVAGCSLICLAALILHSGIVPGALGFGFIFIGLGLRIRAFLFTGTIALIISVIQQLIVLTMTYSFFKWSVGLLTGIGSIAIAAKFEKQRGLLNSKLKNYGNKLQNWQ